MTTSVDIVNQTLLLIDAQTVITTLGDPAQPASVAAGIIYTPTVQMLLRQLDPDFARYQAVPLQPVTGGSLGPWLFEYLYPVDCLRLRQVQPAPGAYNPLDPQPVLANVAFDLVADIPTKVIYTNQAPAVATYTTSRVSENQWDNSFAEAMRRQLANPLSMALAGRPDFARELLEEAMKYEQMAEMADEGAARA